MELYFKFYKKSEFAIYNQTERTSIQIYIQPF